MSFSYGTMWPVYAKQWDAMEAIDDEWKATFKRARRACHQQQGALSGRRERHRRSVDDDRRHPPRESDCDFDTYLGNGEPLDEVTTLVPAGRGPFDSWEEGAIDALTYDGLTEVTDWRLEKMLFHLEKYNGLGYHNKGLPSPYLWAGTTIQEPGKYVADGSSTPMPWDQQPGCCGVLYAIHRLDPPAQYERETAMEPWI